MFSIRSNFPLEVQTARSWAKNLETIRSIIQATINCVQAKKERTPETTGNHIHSVVENTPETETLVLVQLLFFKLLCDTFSIRLCFKLVVFYPDLYFSVLGFFFTFLSNPTS